MESTVMRDRSAEAGSGMVSVTTTSVMGDSRIRSSAGPEKTPCVASE